MNVKSWITDHNFTEIINLSFSISKCCNVLLSDSTEDSEIFFDRFRTIYPYDYFLKRNTNEYEEECDGYLLLGSRDHEIMEFIRKIPSLLWKTEILIIVDNDISIDSNILDNSIYGIASVNIVSTSGIWKLSDNYLSPRVFYKLDRYEEIKIDENINFRGQELQVCSIYNPPMAYMNHTIRKTINGFEAEVYAMDNDLDWDGIEMRLFLIMAEKLNFTWTIRKPEGNYTYGKRFNETYWIGGIIQMLVDQKVDIAFASIWMTLDQNKFVTLSMPWYDVYLHFLVPRPHRTTSFWALKKPFSKKIWCLLLSALLLHSLYTYVRSWIDSKFPKRYRNFLITFIDLIGYLLSSSVPKTAVPNRVQILLWQTVGWLIIAAYCSSLAARLATWEYESRIDTFKQFVEANLSWGKSGQPPPFDDYFDLSDPHSAQLRNRYRQIENNTQLEKFIMEGNYAILGKIIETCFVPTDYITTESLKNYRLMRESLGHFYASFAIQPRLLKPINKMILWLKESGIVIWHLRDVIRRRGNYNFREVFIERDRYDGSVQVLGLTPLGAGFSLLLVGFFIATLVFCLELKHFVGKMCDLRILINRKHDS
ncbi:hypothetical protein HZU73_09183 [Apis mellifera caucasica]|nr:uncharacterized protein LOC725724 isoform X2 [Apis mellifera]KAG6795400.1 hypothetical protein HZU73_09183 [Apis mellifera caucasica]KAG9438259.1 hypothetical protein HZU67_01269 [Apis mellifera carnica]|eukprot:XP_001121536.2 uncharacterized protein LOC725724 isoform X2 [Apis mellifera]